MTINEKKREELTVIVRPVMEWMAKNCHPHVTAIVDSECFELTEGVTTIGRSDDQE